MVTTSIRAGSPGSIVAGIANSTFNQVKSLYLGRTDAQIWKMVGVTPMLGQNDDGRIYDQADARQLVSFAQSKHLGMLSFWELGRDANACSGPLYRCTNIAQQPYEFSRIFAGYNGYGESPGGGGLVVHGGCRGAQGRSHHRWSRLTRRSAALRCR